ncbi:Omp28-related outer membrane protein [Candidatus Marinimicrobia bacterium]|nr:Omp28-related outer membrane protein [Candidatus Neomarinimicrobiota bacterium]
MINIIHKITFALLLLLVFCCEDSNINREFSDTPTSFTKKVLLEEFTGSWCGYCPSGAEILQNLMNSYSVIGVALHSSDDMSIAHTSVLESFYPSSGYPSGMVDRINFDGIVGLNRGYWSYITDQQLQKSAICGLAINSEISGDSVNIQIRSAFDTTMTMENYNLNVYIIEDDVQGEGYGYDQRNYYNDDAESSFYQLGDPIINYKHNQTLRKVLTNTYGIPFTSSSSPGTEFIDNFKEDITNFNKNKLSVVAFITYNGAAATNHEVLNAQKCDIDGFQDWD